MASLESFNAAIDIYIYRPQVVNRRCGGAVVLVTIDQIQSSATQLLTDACSLLVKYNDIETGCEPSTSLLTLAENLLKPTAHSLLVRKLISKQSRVVFPYEIIIRANGVCHFIPVESDGSHLFPVGVVYSFTFDLANKSVSMATSNHLQLNATTCSHQWLKDTLLAKINKWMNSSVEFSEHNGSMKHIDTDFYYSKYMSMKDKYGKAICEMWPECTDPLKFVYEDVAIACYLICLWEKEREKKGLPKKQRFVDLGCGNGLLVYILSDQGYHGYGIDVRRRGIWGLLSPVADLQEQSLVPSESELFPEADWLIGNHSDELTPWIPVMASRSSKSCQFFVLPCCPHDFYGKYQRLNASQSVYSEYLGYICEITEKCGFTYHRDSLRIPSTKKECIIGWRGELTYYQYEEIQQQIVNMLASGVVNQSEETNMTFTPRSKVEPVTNCATVSRTVQEKIIQLLTDKLLSTQNLMYTESGQRWNMGGILTLSEVAQLLKTHSLLLPLKAECGGLKTLLKNHHHIFTVLPETKGVRLTNLSHMKGNSHLATAKRKTKICWFHHSHPDGCLLSLTSCRYAHGSADLRPFSTQ